MTAQAQHRADRQAAISRARWAQEVADKPSEDETDQWMREEAIVTAAAIASRDGGADLISTHGKWIRETFGRAFKGKNDPVHRTRAGLQFNPIAIAFVGTALLLRNRFAMEDVHTLLDAAGDDNPAAAQGFVYVVAALAAIDERLPRAALRCAFPACVDRSPARRSRRFPCPLASLPKNAQYSFRKNPLRWLNGFRLKLPNRVTPRDEAIISRLQEVGGKRHTADFKSAEGSVHSL